MPLTRKRPAPTRRPTPDVDELIDSYLRTFERDDRAKFNQELFERTFADVVRIRGRSTGSVLRAVLHTELALLQKCNYTKEENVRTRAIQDTMNWYRRAVPMKPGRWAQRHERHVERLLSRVASQALRDA